MGSPLNPDLVPGTLKRLQGPSIRQGAGVHPDSRCRHLSLCSAATSFTCSSLVQAFTTPAFAAALLANGRAEPFLHSFQYSPILKLPRPGTRGCFSGVLLSSGSDCVFFFDLLFRCFCCFCFLFVGSLVHCQFYNSAFLRIVSNQQCLLFFFICFSSSRR